MTPEEIYEIVCHCNKKDFDAAIRDVGSGHFLCSVCNRVFESLAKFTCALCGESAINIDYFHPFNLFKDYNSDGTLKTLLSCKECND